MEFKVFEMGNGLLAPKDFINGVVFTSKRLTDKISINVNFYLKSGEVKTYCVHIGGIVTDNPEYLFTTFMENLHNAFYAKYNELGDDYHFDVIEFVRDTIMSDDGFFKKGE